MNPVGGRVPEPPRGGGGGPIRPIPLRDAGGIHHVTAICSDAQANVDFYVGELGLRLVKRTVNQADPGIYHLFYGSRDASPGTLITFSPYPDLPRGRAGAGMVHRVIWRISSFDALDFWARRLGMAPDRDAVVFTDADGLEHELKVVAGLWDRRLAAPHPEIPPEFALGGILAVRAFESAPDPGWPDEFVAEPPPELPGRQGAGTVHHVAFAIPDRAYEGWRVRLLEAGVELVDVADRSYFRSLYFREPGGVLFELATREPGLTVDEPLERLGERLSVPPRFAGQVPDLAALENPWASGSFIEIPE